MDFHFSVLSRNYCAIVWASGRCDAGNAAQLRDSLIDLLSPSSARMVLDLSGLILLDGAGLDALAAVGRRARELGGSMAIAGGPCLQPGDAREA